LHKTQIAVRIFQ